MPQAVETFTNDDDGNLTSDGRWNYTWDGENRLVTMEARASVPAEAKQRLEFAYDHMARRTQKNVSNWNAATSLYELRSVSATSNRPLIDYKYQIKLHQDIKARQDKMGGPG